jgi:hypothetical protein
LSRKECQDKVDGILEKNEVPSALWKFIWGEDGTVKEHFYVVLNIVLGRSVSSGLKGPLRRKFMLYSDLVVPSINESNTRNLQLVVNKVDGERGADHQVATIR